MRVTGIAAIAGVGRPGFSSVTDMILPFAGPRREDLDLRGSLRPTPALRGKGFALAAVSPAFGRCAPCQAG